MHRNVFILLALSLLTATGMGFASVRAKLEGRVIQADAGRALPGATVEILKEGVAVSSVATDKEGRFGFPTVEPGEYEFRARLNGFFPVKQRLVLRPRDALELTVELHPLTAHHGVAYTTGILLASDQRWHL